MNPPETLLLFLPLMACLAAGFFVRAGRQAGWCRAIGWLAALTGASWGCSALIARFSISWDTLLHVAAALLPVGVMMIPLLGMLALAWLTGSQLAGGFLLLTKRFTK